MPSEPSSKDDAQSADKRNEERLRHHAGNCEHCDAVDPCPCCGLRIAVRDLPCTKDPEHAPHLVSECAAPTPPFTGQRTAEQQAILSRLQDAALLANPDLQESLAQLRRGEAEAALTQAEEVKEGTCTCSSRLEGVGGNLIHDEDCNALRESWPCVHESWNVTSEWYDPLSMKWHKSRRCNDCGESLDVIFEDGPHFPENEGKGAPSEPEPPQPERRPPYAVAYSVGGHLYELALPGDAAVQTVDGALVITHVLGPVNGVVQVQPIASKEGGDV
ncbi:hypothetical protein [Streptomyces formicae]|uniref:Uncharacterized protein n=1 Tax=Streptomyces formicae TaxID=1616117 RepID=A0ABY3WLU1_9ACTN|nr:hypothetical protein [Streptomyces formicae]UNM12307.1 hypothetical protein J4032_12880 [Streptomyces formicae]